MPTLLIGIFVYFRLARRGHWTMKKDHVRYALDLDVPLIPHNLSHMVLSSADKVMINSMISASASGFTVWSIRWE